MINWDMLIIYMFVILTFSVLVFANPRLVSPLSYLNVTPHLWQFNRVCPSQLLGLYTVYIVCFTSY